MYSNHSALAAIKEGFYPSFFIALNKPCYSAPFQNKFNIQNPKSKTNLTMDAIKSLTINA